jgi:hypothetical protein
LNDKDFELLTSEEALRSLWKLRDEFALSGEFNQENSSSNNKNIREDDENKFHKRTADCDSFVW